MFCKIVEQMFYKVAGLGHRTTMLTCYPNLLSHNLGWETDRITFNI